MKTGRHPSRSPSSRDRVTGREREEAPSFRVDRGVDERPEPHPKEVMQRAVAGVWLDRMFWYLPHHRKLRMNGPCSRPTIRRHAGSVQRSAQLGGALDLPGPAGDCGGQWFGRFPARMESREDTYLLDPQLRGLSAKVRGGGALDVKAYRGSPGILEVAGHARGRLEAWQKWSFPSGPLRQDSGDPARWRPVRKRRRISRFSLAGGQIVARAPGLGREPRCEVELTEVRTPWPGLVDAGIRGHRPCHPAPRRTRGHRRARVRPRPARWRGTSARIISRSYAEWLGQRPGADSDAVARRL